MDTDTDEIWNMFPAIFCINLKSRDDRFLSTVQTMVEMKLSPKRVHFHRTEKDPRGGRYGCADAHIACSRKAYQMNVPYALILEDDIVPEQNWRAQLTQIREFLNKKQPFDIIRLYSMLRIPLQQVHKDIWNVGALSGAAYIVSRSFMQRLLQFKYTGIHIDALHSLAAKQPLDIYPPVFNVSDASSDNVWAVQNTKNDSLLSKAMFYINYAMQTWVAGRKSIDLTNKVLAMCPSTVCNIAYKKWLLGLIEGNEISDELASQLKIADIVSAMKQ